MCRKCQYINLGNQHFSHKPARFKMFLHLRRRKLRGLRKTHVWPAWLPCLWSSDNPMPQSVKILFRIYVILCAMSNQRHLWRICSGWQKNKGQWQRKVRWHLTRPHKKTIWKLWQTSNHKNDSDLTIKSDSGQYSCYVCTDNFRFVYILAFTQVHYLSGYG